MQPKKKEIKMPDKQSLRSSDLKKPVKKVVKKAVAKPVAKSSALSVPMYSLTAKESGVLDLPESIFGQKLNKSLLAQALRVYANNQRGHWSHTKTRSEVQGSTAKMGAQKGSGHARHGSKRSPVFVGGGIALGPRFHKTELDLPKQMKKQALVAAMVAK